METMKAIRVHEYGGPEVLRYEEAPRPQPGPGEVLVRIRAAGVNPVDWQVREGHRREALAYRMPFVPGWDVSGVVEATGPNVTLLTKGDEVYGYPSVVRNGAYAEYAVVPEAELALKPRSIDHVLAASVPIAALTAWQGLFDAGGLRTDQKVLIHGGAGGVGSFAVQLARWKGAFIVATASGRNQEFLRNLGADLTIDYEKTRFDRLVCDADVVFVHAKSAEEEFLREGHGVQRFPVMYNDFVIVGPKSDPAGIARGADAPEALRRIKSASAAFVSRGDRSGTHIAEINLWTAAGIDIAKEKGPWYRETGQGMGPALNTASSMNAYLLSDRATWLAFSNRGELAILVEGDKRLLNQYGVMLVNPEKHPNVKRALAQTFIDWLVSKRGQDAIAGYKIGGEPLFFPNAGTDS